MFEAKCYDKYDNSIDGFMQWDINQRIVIKIEGCDDKHISDALFSIDPEVHFSNVKRDKALIVRPVEANKTNVVVDVPNILLTEPYPLLIYVYLTYETQEEILEDGELKDPKNLSQKTRVFVELPVRQRSEPHDYYYVENIERITAEQIKREIEQDTENTRKEAIRVINETKSEAVDTVTSTRDEAVSTITSTKNDAVQYVNDSKEYITTAVADVHSTQNAINEVYEDTVDVYNKAVANAKEEVSAEVMDRLYTYGVAFNIYDDGNGNVIMGVKVPNTEDSTGGDA